MRIGLLVLVLLAGPACAQSNGILLVAKPGTADPNFSQTVIVVARAEDGSTVGVILNRPLEQRAENYPERVYAGGPVMREVLVALFAADERVRARPGKPVRLFAGFSGWAPRQLEAEIDQGAWYALRASEPVLFRKDTAGLWRDLIERANGPRAELY